MVKSYCPHSFCPGLYLHDPDFEVLWVRTRAIRLPRGFSCVITGTVYHPPSVDDKRIVDYLLKSLTEIEGRHPSCGILLSGDFNRLDVNRLLRQFNMKQLVKIPTRKVLDLVMTNMSQYYNNDSVKAYPPFGLSDHNVMTVFPKERISNQVSRKVIKVRDTRPSRKQEFGRNLNSIDWSIIESNSTCTEKNHLLVNLINTGFNTLMPIKEKKVHISDPPWITAELKHLIFINSVNEHFITNTLIRSGITVILLTLNGKSVVVDFSHQK